MKRKFKALFIGLLSLLVCLGILAGCSKEKTFEKAGMQITLTSDFYEKDYVSLTAYYESRSAIVTVTKEEFSLLDGFKNYTLTQYTNTVLKANKLTAEVSSREGQNYQYFTYEKSVSGKDFYYLATTHKGTDAFWLIQFACEVSDKDSYTETFLGWADTVTFGSQEV